MRDGVDERPRDEAPAAGRREAHPAPGASGPARVRGVDVLRGLTLAVMLLTPLSAEPGGSYPHLAHATWNGFTVSDAVFPVFLVTSGASLAFLLRPPVAAERRRRLVTRFLGLLVLGVLYNQLGQPLALDGIRVTGVLVLIGIAGGVGATLILLARRLPGTPWVLGAVALALPIAYGLSLEALGGGCTGPDAGCSPWVGVDRGLLGASHLYRGGTAGYDPEGLVVSVVAAALVVLGYLAGDELRRHRPPDRAALLRLAALGVGLLALGLLVAEVQAPNKRLLTPAFTFLAAGIGVVGLTAAAAVTDALGARVADGDGRWPRWALEAGAAPFETLGRNALVVFFTEKAFIEVTRQTQVDGVLLQTHLLDLLAVDGARVHLLYTALLLGVVLLVTGVMRALRWHVVL